MPSANKAHDVCRITTGEVPDNLASRNPELRVFCKIRDRLISSCFQPSLGCFPDTAYQREICEDLRPEPFGINRMAGDFMAAAEEETRSSLIDQFLTGEHVIKGHIPIPFHQLVKMLPCLVVFRRKDIMVRYTCPEYIPVPDNFVFVQIFHTPLPECTNPDGGMNGSHRLNNNTEPLV
jgi:hypothetical protein